MDVIPIGRRHGGHLSDAEILVYVIERGGCSGASGRGHCGTRFMGKDSACRIEHSVEHRKKPSACVGVIDRGAENKSVAVLCLVYNNIYNIMVKNTFAV